MTANPFPPSLALPSNTVFTPRSALRLYCMLAAKSFLSPSFLTLSLNLEKWHEEQADEAQCRGKPKERSVWLECIMHVVARRRGFPRNTCMNCSGNAKTKCDRQFDGRLENGAGYGLLRLGQGGDEIHLGCTMSATPQKLAGPILYSH